MTRINLLINKLIERRKKKRFIIFIITTIIVVLTSTLSIYFVKLWQYKGIKQDLDLVEEQLLDIEEVISKTESLKKEKELMKKRIDIIKNLLKDQMIWAQILGEINKSIPSGVWLQNFTFEESRLSLKGSSFGNYPIANLMINLSKSYLFTEVSLISIDKVTKSEKKYHNFHIIFKLT
ncbi:MAG: PilN domain-containing protein [bacterium]|nr:PilN domain-containing protein [bacterium]